LLGEGDGFIPKGGLGRLKVTLGYKAMHIQEETTATMGEKPNGAAQDTQINSPRAEGRHPNTPRDRDPVAGAVPGGEPSSDPDRHALYDQVRAELAGAGLHEEEIQYELARWIELLETSAKDIGDGRGRAADAKQEFVQRLVRKAGAAIPALVSDKPELVFARTLRIRAEMQMLRRNGWPSRLLVTLTDGSPTLLVGLGTLVAVLAGALIHLLWPWLSAKPYVQELVPLDATVAPMVAGAAFLGGAVSIMTRLQAFSRLRDFDPMFLFLNALAKPLLGVVFGLFAYASVKSGLLPLDKTTIEAATSYHWWALGFLAGFSERFANDLVSRGEGLASPKRS
jgi:hypothetical protein